MKLVLAVLVAACVAPGVLVAQSPVMVELFTSEGCSSCPPADALLVKLSQMKGPNLPDIIVLGEHVDYWDRIGWSDRFSSAQFTSRQQGYAQHFGLASPYTPQMVIDGRQQIVGNDAAGVARDIDAAAKVEKPASITVAQLADGHYSVAVQAPNTKGRVFLAITEDGLSSEVKGGENSGRTLRHAGVVRELRGLGALKDGRFERDLSLKIKPEWNPANLRAIVFVQKDDYGPILGAAYVRMASNSTAALSPAHQ